MGLLREIEIEKATSCLPTPSEEWSSNVFYWFGRDVALKAWYGWVTIGAEGASFEDWTTELIDERDIGYDAWEALKLRPSVWVSESELRSLVDAAY